jgi:hypothetical protein
LIVKDDHQRLEEILETIQSFVFIEPTS